MWTKDDNMDYVARANELGKISSDRAILYALLAIEERMGQIAYILGKGNSDIENRLDYIYGALDLDSED